MAEIVIGNWPSILKVFFESISLTIIYFILAEMYKNFPSLGFSNQSVGGTNEGAKPNDIHYTGAYKTLIICIQEIAAVLISSHHFNFSISTWWSTLCNPNFGAPPASSSYMPLLLELMHAFWMIGIIHYGFMLDDSPHGIRTWHKVGAVSATLFGSRAVYHAPNSVAHALFAAKLPGLIESLLTVAHARGIFYTKGGVALATFGTVYNAIMRFIVEPIVIYKLFSETLSIMVGPMDFLIAIGSFGLLTIHWIFSIKAIQGLPNLFSKLKKIESKSD